MEIEKMGLESLTESELQATDGGILPFIAGIVVGWVVSEVVQGIYQADKNGCL